MRSVVETLQRAISAFDDIKSEIEKKGIQVGSKSVSEYASCIAEIQTGSSNLQDKTVEAEPTAETEEEATETSDVENSSEENN